MGAADVCASLGKYQHRILVRHVPRNSVNENDDSMALAQRVYTHPVLQLYVHICMYVSSYVRVGVWRWGEWVDAVKEWVCCWRRGCEQFHCAVPTSLIAHVSLAIVVGTPLAFIAHWLM